MLETKQLKYFVTAADSPSFREAARKLFTTQSNVSKVISSLEKQVGCNLFTRGSTGCHLTPAGVSLYGNANQVLDLVATMTAKLRIEG